MPRYHVRIETQGCIPQLGPGSPPPFLLFAGARRAPGNEAKFYQCHMQRISRNIIRPFVRPCKLKHRRLQDLATPHLMRNCGKRILSLTVRYTYICARICYMLVTTCLRIQSCEYAWFEITLAMPRYALACRCLWVEISTKTVLSILVPGIACCHSNNLQLHLCQLYWHCCCHRNRTWFESLAISTFLLLVYLQPYAWRW